MEIDEVKLRTLSNMAQEMRAADREVQELEEKLRSAKEKFNRYSAIEIPQFMSDLGVKEFKLSDGTKFAVVPVLQITYLKDTIDAVEDWLIDHGHPGLVKSNIILAFPRGQDEKIAMMLEWFREKRIKYEIKKAIHPQTLKAWAREMEDEGMVIPEDIFTVYRSAKTIITQG